MAEKFNTALYGPDSPYYGMREAFEAHYGQSWTDKDWRNEASTWAAAWKAALLKKQGVDARADAIEDAANTDSHFLNYLTFYADLHPSLLVRHLARRLREARSAARGSQVPPNKRASALPPYMEKPATSEGTAMTRGQLLQALQDIATFVNGICFVPLVPQLIKDAYSRRAKEVFQLIDRELQIDGIGVADSQTLPATSDAEDFRALALQAGIGNAYRCGKPDECPEDDDCCHHNKREGYWVRDEQLTKFARLVRSGSRQTPEERALESIRDAIDEASDMREHASELTDELEFGYLVKASPEDKWTFVMDRDLLNRDQYRAGMLNVYVRKTELDAVTVGRHLTLLDLFKAIEAEKAAQVRLADDLGPASTWPFTSLPEPVSWVEGSIDGGNYIKPTPALVDLPVGTKIYTEPPPPPGTPIAQVIEIEVGGYTQSMIDTIPHRLILPVGTKLYLRPEKRITEAEVASLAKEAWLLTGGSPDAHRRLVKLINDFFKE